MSDKYKQQIKVSELKESFKAQFNEISPRLERRERMKIAIAVDVALETVNRYMDGTLADIRRLELAEDILSTAKEVLSLKETASSTT